MEWAGSYILIGLAFAMLCWRQSKKSDMPPEARILREGIPHLFVVGATLLWPYLIWRGLKAGWQDWRDS